VSGTALVRRPTEDAALRRSRRPASAPVPVLAVLLAAARATGDRYGARLLACLLDRSRSTGGAR
jgi:hypothetical protein